MILAHLIVASLAAKLATSYLVTPDGTAFPGADSDCSAWVQGTTGIPCSDIAAVVGITLTEFETWNPLVADGSICEVTTGYWYCIRVDFESISSTSTTKLTPTSIVASTTTAASTTSTGYGISTPSPIQTGMVSTCDEFYLVVSGDDCATVAASAGISLDTFYAWNPAVGSSCADLDLNEYVCIDIIGYTITSTTATSTTSGDGISTPSPIQTGMVSTCDEFHLVVSGDDCATIAASAGISLDIFYAWNPAVGSSCADLELDEYVCIDIIGYTPSTTTTSTSTTTSSGNGITTPTPYETGMVSDCDSFYLVTSGDTCTSIADSAGITVADIEAWNTDVGTDCTDIWLNYYICVGIL